MLGYLELDRPVGLIVCGLLHQLHDALDPAGVMRDYIERLPRGSYVAISHFWDPAEEDPELHRLAARLQRAFVDGVLGSAGIEPVNRSVPIAVGWNYWNRDSCLWMIGGRPARACRPVRRRL